MKILLYLYTDTSLILLYLYIYTNPSLQFAANIKMLFVKPKTTGWFERHHICFPLASQVSTKVQHQFLVTASQMGTNALLLLSSPSDSFWFFFLLHSVSPLADFGAKQQPRPQLESLSLVLLHQRRIQSPFPSCHLLPHSGRVERFNWHWENSLLNQKILEESQQHKCIFSSLREIIGIVFKWQPFLMHS